MRKIFCIFAILLFIPLIFAQNVNADSENKSFKLFLSSDIHSYFVENYDIDDEGQTFEHGDSTKLATVLKQRRGNDSLYLDGGDFSMGTLMQTGFTDKAYELRLLGLLGCDATTLGNHEFDFGPDGLSSMLNSAKKYSTQLPEITLSNINLQSENLKSAFENYGVKPYTIKEVNGVKVGIFGLDGKISIDCAPTNEQQWTDYIESAKQTVAELKDKCDVIVCLSHCGLSEDGESGEDLELVKAVPEINVCLSAHSHHYFDPKKINDSYIISPGCYLRYIDQVNMQQNDKGKWEMTFHDKIPISGNIQGDEILSKTLYDFGVEINNNYVKKYSGNDGPIDVICYNPIDFDTVAEMRTSDKEYPLQDLIADSYMYEAKQNGINDVDFAAVGIGTVRNALVKGDISTSYAFEVCSLGKGKDGSAGHPICGIYVSGKDLKTFVEIETSLGKLKEGVKMSYSGLQVTWNSNRMIMDKVTDIKIKRENGELEELDDNKMYKCIANVYALNMLNSVSGLTGGLIKVEAKNANGETVTDFYDVSLKNKAGLEIKEWVAFKNYLKFLKVVPEQYSAPQGRKINTNKTGLDIISNPGIPTIIVIVITILIVFIVVLIVRKLVLHFRKH